MVNCGALGCEVTGVEARAPLREDETLPCTLAQYNAWETALAKKAHFANVIVLARSWPAVLVSVA